MAIEKFTEHLHRPPHLFRPQSIYFVTGATLKKKPFLNTDTKKENLQIVLQQQAKRLDWDIQAWVIFDNHYHFVGKAPEEHKSLKRLIRSVHSINAKYVNKQDGVSGRRIWYNYWDTCITNEGSYLARLHYVHVNPVKHGIVQNPEDYSYSSYSWFMNSFEADFCNSVMNLPINQLKIIDDF